jgi:hypothetical protein
MKPMDIAPPPESVSSHWWAYFIRDPKAPLHYPNPKRKGVNILPKTLFVGCDVSSKNNTVCLMDKEGKEMGYPTIPNTLPEATALESELL